MGALVEKDIGPRHKKNCYDNFIMTIFQGGRGREDEVNNKQ